PTARPGAAASRRSCGSRRATAPPSSTTPSVRRRGRLARSRARPGSRIPWSAPARGRLGGLEVREEAVDDRGGALVVGEALADDTRREVERERTHLGAQRDERRGLLGL